MTSAGLALRSAFLWALSVLYFFPACTLVVIAGAVIGQRRVDPFLRALCRNVVRLAGAGYEIRRAQPLPPRACFFAANHVEIFDPFLLYPAMPEGTRGLELESHFRVPVYGWLMRSFGNVPVPDVLTRDRLARMRERVRAAITNGTSLIVFPEGSRTRTGRVGTFRSGSFRLAIELGVPVIPVSLDGAYELKRVGDWRLLPSNVVVRLHEPIETSGMTASDARALAERVREIVRGAVERG